MLDFAGRFSQRYGKPEKVRHLGQLYRRWSEKEMQPLRAVVDVQPTDDIEFLESSSPQASSNASSQHA
jgi:hypothetical protein